MLKSNQDHKKRTRDQKESRKKRRRKNKDGAWRKNQSAKARDVSSFSTEGFLRFMKAASLHAPKMAVLSSSETKILEGETTLCSPAGKHSSQLLTPSKYKASTPDAGPRTSQLITPQGTKMLPSRIIELDDGTISIFLPQDKVIEKNLVIPLSPKPWIQHSPIPEVGMEGMVDIPITKKKLKIVEKLTRNRKRVGTNPRKISQNELNKIPATKAMRKAGIEVNDGDGHYLHFIPFSFLGDEAQTVNNMGIGTRFANAAMELVNPVIRRLLYMKNAPKVVYLSAIPEWVPGYEKIRLLKSITYIIKDGKGNDFQHSAKVTFNTISLREVCLSEVRPVRDTIVQKFSGKTPKKLANTPRPTTPLSATTKQKFPQELPISPTSMSPANKKSLQKISPDWGSPQSPSFPLSPTLAAYKQFRARYAANLHDKKKVSVVPIRKLSF